MRKSTSKQKQKPVRYAALLRCSSDDSAAGDFTTIDTQRAITNRYIEEQIAASLLAGGPGGVRVGEYVAEGWSGKDLKRPDWRAAYADAQGRRYDVLVVSYMSRLGRGDAYTVGEWLLKAENVTVEMVKEYFTPDMAGRTQKRITILADQMYIDQVSGWTRAKQEIMVERGYCMGGRPRYGYHHETVPGMAPVNLPGGKVKPAPKRPVPHPDEYQNARAAFDTMATHDNLGVVQRFLQKVAPERRWTVDSVRRMLTDEFYIGILNFGKHTNKTAHEAIIPEYLWDTVQKLMKKRDEAEELPSGGEGRELGYRVAGPIAVAAVEEQPFTPYLRGLVHCPHCGHRMTPTSSHGRTGKAYYYTCVCALKRASETPCPVARVNARTLHEVVLAEIERCAIHPTRLQIAIRAAASRLPAPNELRETIKRLERNQRSAETKLRECQSVIEAGKGQGVTLLSLVTRVAELEKHQNEIEADLTAARARLRETTGQRPDVNALAACWREFRANWEYLTETERSELMSLLVERVTVEEKAKGTLHLYCSVPNLVGSFIEPEEVRGSPQLPPYLTPSKLSPPPTSPKTCAFELTIPRGGRNRRGSAKEASGV